MTVHGHRIRIFLVAITLAVPLGAQQPDDRIQQLENKLDELLRQATAIRQELDALKGVPAPTEPDLTKVEVVMPAVPEAPSLTEVTTVENVITAGAGKALNPDISVIGTMVGHAGDQNLFEGAGPENLGEGRSPFQFQEAELAFETFVDPYMKGRFFIALEGGEVDLEEGYAQFVALPNGFTGKAGKFKSMFGKANTWHTHIRPWIDQPLMISNFFGAEGLADTGLSLSRSISNPWNAFIEATGEVGSGNVDGVFERQNSNDLFYNAHLKLYRDITEDSNIEVGTSWARGTLEGASNRFAGVDVTYRWKPLRRSIYNSFRGRFEGLANRRPGSDRTLYGYYASADYQLSRRWFAGVRLDRADRNFVFGEGVLDERFTDRGISATLTFRPSEFSQIRGQFRRTSYGSLEEVNEFLVQLQFAIGAHGAHTF